MEDRLHKEVRFLKIYALVMTCLFGALLFYGFKLADQKSKFEEIDVERINIIEKDGKVRLIISNKGRAPDPILDGKSYPLRQGGNDAGMIFLNEKGDECGGLVYNGDTKDGQHRAGAALLFDQYRQDQTIGLQYGDNNGRRSAGLTVWDRPDTPLAETVERLQSIRNLSEGPEKAEAISKLQESARNGEFGVTRLIVGKGADKSAKLMMADTKGRPRINLVVDESGAPKLEFLDEKGQVIYSLPPAAEKSAPVRK